MMSKPKVYLAGPMTGIPHFNFPAFAAAAAMLRQYGVEVISPAELDDKKARKAAASSEDGDPVAYRKATGETWGDFLSRDVKIVADEVDGVAVLPGWADSRGARLEVYTALLCGKPIYDYPRWRGAYDGHKAGERPNFIGCIADDSYRVSPQHLNASLIKESNGRFLTAVKDLPDYPSGADLGITTADINPYLPRGEERITSDTGGQKGRKPQRTDLLPPEFLLGLSEVYGMGAEKYDAHNYLKGYDWSLSFGALLRHVYAAQNGEWLDEESELPHILHAAWHCSCLFMFEKHGLGTDDRISSVVDGLDG